MSKANLGWLFLLKVSSIVLITWSCLYLTSSTIPFKNISNSNDFNKIHSNHSNIITIDNFNSQSDFKLFNIYPYNKISKSNFNDWLNKQNNISFNKILLNIADPNLNNDLITKFNVSLGVNIASTSKKNPNYFFQWIRDGAITINSIINYLDEIDNFNNKTLQSLVENYLQNNFNLQRLNNLSGNFSSLHRAEILKNLGEPKFLVNSTPFNEIWGRPQNDGPALRIISIDNFLKNLKKFNKELINKNNNNLSSFEDIYFNILKLDLQYIIWNWNFKTFDIWEEINSFHFATSLIQLKALKIGLKNFYIFNDHDKLFEIDLKNSINNLYHFIMKDSGFINYNLNHIVETPSILNQRSGLDSAILIASIITHDDDEDDSTPFNVNDCLILNTLNELIKKMKYLYPINHSKINLNLGIAIGRYPEDIYNGLNTNEIGNPWFLTTLSSSELLFKLIINLYKLKQDLNINIKKNNFFNNHIIEDLNNNNNNDFEILNIPYNSIAFNQTINNLFNYSDSFLDIIREHISNDGSMSEQFNKNTGFMQGAENLTWSYGSFWNCFRWRQKALNLINE